MWSMYNVPTEVRQTSVKQQAQEFFADRAAVYFSENTHNKWTVTCYGLLIK